MSIEASKLLISNSLGTSNFTKHPDSTGMTVANSKVRFVTWLVYESVDEN